MGEQESKKRHTGRRIPAPLRRELRRIRRWLGDSPVFLPIVLRATPLGVSRQIRPSTVLVVEGFPRSGNTYAAFVMRHLLADTPGAHVASHVHTPSQARRAVARGIPTLIVIRPPDEVVCSLLVAAPHVSARSALREWIHHYQVLRPLADDLVVASLAELVDDMPSVLQRLSDRFGPVVDATAWSDEVPDAVRQAIVAHHLETHGGEPTTAPWPAEHRLLMGRAARELVDPTLALLRQRADALFADYLVLAARRAA